MQTITLHGKTYELTDWIWNGYDMEILAKWWNKNRPGQGLEEFCRFWAGKISTVDVTKYRNSR
jgi:hypothetical protein